MPAKGVGVHPRARREAQGARTQGRLTEVEGGVPPNVERHVGQARGQLLDPEASVAPVHVDARRHRVRDPGDPRVAQGGVHRGLERGLPERQAPVEHPELALTRERAAEGRVQLEAGGGPADPEPLPGVVVDAERQRAHGAGEGQVADGDAVALEVDGRGAGQREPRVAASEGERRELHREGVAGEREPDGAAGEDLPVLRVEVEAGDLEVAALEGPLQTHLAEVLPVGPKADGLDADRAGRTEERAGEAEVRLEFPQEVRPGEQQLGLRHADGELDVGQGRALEVEGAAALHRDPARVLDEEAGDLDRQVAGEEGGANAAEPEPGDHDVLALQLELARRDPAGGRRERRAPADRAEVGRGGDALGARGLAARGAHGGLELVQPGELEADEAADRGRAGVPQVDGERVDLHLVGAHPDDPLLEPEDAPPDLTGESVGGRGQVLGRSPNEVPLEEDGLRREVHPRANLGAPGVGGGGALQGDGPRHRPALDREVGEVDDVAAGDDPDLSLDHPERGERREDGAPRLGAGLVLAARDVDLHARGGDLHQGQGAGVPAQRGGDEVALGREGGAGRPYEGGRRVEGADLDAAEPDLAPPVPVDRLDGDLVGGERPREVGEHPHQERVEGALAADVEGREQGEEHEQQDEGAPRPTERGAAEPARDAGALLASLPVCLLSCHRGRRLPPAGRTH